MNAQGKRAARDRIAALRARWMRASDAGEIFALQAAERAYLRALESLVDELTVPEPEDMTRDLERSLVKVQTERACGVKRNVRVTR